MQEEGVIRRLSVSFVMGPFVIGAAVIGAFALGLAMPAAAQTTWQRGVPAQGWQQPRREPPPPDLSQNLQRLRQARQAQDRALMQDARMSETVRRLR